MRRTSPTRRFMRNISYTTPCVPGRWGTWRVGGEVSVSAERSLTSTATRPLARCARLSVRRCARSTLGGSAGGALSLSLSFSLTSQEIAQWENQSPGPPLMKKTSTLDFFLEAGVFIRTTQHAREGRCSEDVTQKSMQQVRSSQKRRTTPPTNQPAEEHTVSSSSP